MIEALIWIFIVIGIPTAFAVAAMFVGARADRRARDFTGDQWP